MSPKETKYPSNERAKTTLYVTGFSSRLTSKNLLRELFTQGAPVVGITMFDDHAYVQFPDEKSVAYCFALFNETELNGEKLRLIPRQKSKQAFSYFNYLKDVRQKLRDEYMKLTPPDLPPRIPSDKPIRKKNQIKNSAKLEAKNQKSKSRKIGNKREKFNRPKIRRRRRN